MKFNFKIQQYQTDAVESTVAVFAGQPTQGGFLYRRDLGKNDAGRITYEDDYAGFRNADVELSDQNMLANIRNIQESNNIPLSKALSHDLGKVGLDIEMETGTGKTYVYIKNDVRAEQALRLEQVHCRSAEHRYQRGCSQEFQDA